MLIKFQNMMKVNNKIIIGHMCEKSLFFSGNVKEILTKIHTNSLKCEKVEVAYCLFQ